jgi:hypothetical protein
MVSDSEPLVRQNQDATEAFAIDLEPSSEQEAERVLEEIEDNRSRLGRGSHIEQRHATSLESLERAVDPAFDESLNVLEAIDCLRALTHTGVVIDRREDHHPVEYLWHDGFNFVALNSVQGTDDEYEKEVVEEHVVLHFLTVYPIRFVNVSHTFPLDV